MQRRIGAFDSITINDGELRIMTLTRPREKYAAYKLRKEIFCDALNWVGSLKEEIEVDDYDAHAILIGILDVADELLGTLRIIPAEHAMMIEREFACLVSKTHQIIKRPLAVEISRLCIRRSLRHRQKACVSHALYKGLYHWCLKNAVRFLYLVVECKMLRNLRLIGFPCQTIGPIQTLSGGYRTLAAVMDLNQLDKATRFRFTNFDGGRAQSIPHKGASGHAYWAAARLPIPQSPCSKAPVSK